MHPLISYVQSIVPLNWSPVNGWIVGNCPLCVEQGEKRHDTKRRGAFLFDEEEFVYKCFNCQYFTKWVHGDYFSDRTRHMLKVFGADDSDIHRMLLMLLADGERVAMRNPLPQVQQAFHPQWPEARLPDGASLLSACDYQEIPKGLAGGLQMIHNRRLDHWMDWAYSGEDWQFKNRIILPYRFRGAIVGYNARLINHHEKSKFPKYITAKPPGFVFNLDNQRKKSKSVIITEGDFDAITVGGVSLGTNSASHEQISLISQLKKQPILCPDADQAGEKLIDTAIRAGWYVSFPEWMHEFKDANAAAEKYGRSFVIASILNAATKNSTKIQVLAKMMLT